MTDATTIGALISAWPLPTLTSRVWWMAPCTSRALILLALLALARRLSRAALLTRLSGHHFDLHRDVLAFTRLVRGLYLRPLPQVREGALAAFHLDLRIVGHLEGSPEDAEGPRGHLHGTACGIHLLDRTLKRAYRRGLLGRPISRRSRHCAARHRRRRLLSLGHRRSGGDREAQHNGNR